MKKEINYILPGSENLTQTFLKTNPKVGELIVFSNGSGGIIICSKDYSISSFLVLAFGKILRIHMAINWRWNEFGYWYENKKMKDNQ